MGNTQPVKGGGGGPWVPLRRQGGETSTTRNRNDERDPVVTGVSPRRIGENRDFAPLVPLQNSLEEQRPHDEGPILEADIVIAQHESGHPTTKPVLKLPFEKPSQVPPSLNNKKRPLSSQSAGQPFPSSGHNGLEEQLLSPKSKERLKPGSRTERRHTAGSLTPSSIGRTQPKKVSDVVLKEDFFKQKISEILLLEECSTGNFALKIPPEEDMAYELEFFVCQFFNFNTKNLKGKFPVISGAGEQEETPSFFIQDQRFPEKTVAIFLPLAFPGLEEKLKGRDLCLGRVAPVNRSEFEQASRALIYLLTTYCKVSTRSMTCFDPEGGPSSLFIISGVKTEKAARVYTFLSEISAYMRMLRVFGMSYPQIFKWFMQEEYLEKTQNLFHLLQKVPLRIFITNSGELHPSFYGDYGAQNLPYICQIIEILLDLKISPSVVALFCGLADIMMKNFISGVQDSSVVLSEEASKNFQNYRILIDRGKAFIAEEEKKLKK